MRSSDPLIGQQLANFRVERLLGRGGMGSVYYGWDIKLERPVAIKTINIRYRDNPAYAERFIKEARSMAAWRHPNILPVHYADNQDDVYYFVMEYVRGLDLEQLLKQYASENELPPHEDVLRIGRAVGEALDYAHSKGIIHRDVKPANVMIADDGRVVLTDFGLAMDVSQGSMGEVFGSPQYIAPEQARSSAKATHLSDLYSLGVMLYEMLVGVLPFDDPSPTSLAIQHLTLPPPPPRQVNPALSPAVEEVLLTALNKKPEERYPNGKALMHSLEQALHQPGAESGEAALPAPRPLSQVGVSERVAQYNASRPPTPPLSTARSEWAAVPSTASKAPAPAPSSSIPTSPPASGSLAANPLAWGGIGCSAIFALALLLVGALAIGWWLRSGSASSSVSSTAGPTSIAAALPTSTIQQQEPAPQPTLASTPLPATPEAGEAAPTATKNPVAGITVVVHTIEPDTATPSAAPVAGMPPNENHFALFYNDASLYLKNLSGQDVRINYFAFERLDNNGNPTIRMEGNYWAEIYANFRSGYCVILEILTEQNYLRPPECQGKQLVIRTPVYKQGIIFWTSQEEGQEFRVLWKDQEVGRCAIAAGTCEFYLP